MSPLFQLSVLPALLIILGGLLVRRSAAHRPDQPTAAGEPDSTTEPPSAARHPAAAQRRLLLYLLLVAGVLLLVLYGAGQITTAEGFSPQWMVSNVLTAPLLAVLALALLLSWRLLRAGPRDAITRSRWLIVLALLLTAGLAAFLLGDAGARSQLIYLLPPTVIPLVLGWALARRFPRFALLLALLCLPALASFNILPTLMAQAQSSLGPPPPWLGLIVRTTFVAVPGLTAVLAAALIANSLHAYGQRPSRRNWRLLLPAILSLALLAYFAYTIYWVSVWDQTSDGIGGLFLVLTAGPIALGAGMIMVLLPRTDHPAADQVRTAGLLFTIAAPLLLYASFELGWQAPYHQFTEDRAAHIARALDAHHRREGRYPDTLDALTPRYLLRLPQPVELQGETWCYQGGDDFYRLGAFSREFFSSPINLQVYSEVGQPHSEWACQEQLAQMKERYYSPMADPQAMQPPTPTAQPSSDTARDAQTLPPLLEEGPAVWGDWSPDGSAFPLGQQNDAGSVTLSFLDGATGSLCPIDRPFHFPPQTVSLRPYHAWLPDGRLLLLDAAGAITLATPCQSGLQTVTPPADILFTEIMARDTQSGRLLFKSANEYWILDGPTLTWRPIPDVTPNPYDAHWDNATWQPGGQQLAISRLNGRSADQGSTLYLVDGESGDVLRTVPRAEATDQSAPRVDWLSPHELLYMSHRLLLLDLNSDPPQVTDVLAGIFGLDLDFPGEILGHDWLVDWQRGTYTLGLRANHPRNHAFYLYDAGAGDIDVYEEDGNLMLLYPNGDFEAWPRLETGPPYDDEYVFVDAAREQAHPPFTIEGHNPRNYPRLHIAYLAAHNQFAAASSQGISLHTLPDGQMTTFYTLQGEGFAPFLRPSPTGAALLAIRDLGNIYWVPLE